MKKTPKPLKAPPKLSGADRSALSKILAKARAHKAFYRAQNPLLIKVPASKKAGGKARERRAS